MLKTVAEAATILGVSTDTIRRWEKKGLIRGQRSGNNYRLFELDELERVHQKIIGDEHQSRYRILKSETAPYKVIELFSGAGGMALGFENAGLQTELLVEIDKNPVATLRKNRPHWNVIADDIKKVSFKEYRDKVDVVAGGFPCQAFSYAGLSKGFEDTRGTLFFEFARCVQEVNPKIALAENVRGLLQHDGGRTLATMVNVLDELGYHVVYKLLKAQFHDVPQKRERLIIMGLRKDQNFQHLFPKERDYLVTMREALENCPPSDGSAYPSRKRDILELVPPGGYWRDLPIELQKEYMGGSFYLGGGKTGMARRLAWDEPSLTLTCSPAQKQTERCHPEETRPLNIREYARVQTFPDDWEFIGSVASQYKQIGNAVPVNLAYHIGRCLVTILEGRSIQIDSTEFEFSHQIIPLQPLLV
ncbi:MAG: DNA (cytosine-5-)-methyltransferase [Anaerolineaceae bacterium]|nr:DNA (cytosine-5-)-methyltransferase [Anaerolineaceae bacterium]